MSEADEKPEVMRELNELERQIRAFMGKLEQEAKRANLPRGLSKLRRLQLTGAAQVLVSAALTTLTREERSGVLGASLAFDTVAGLLRGQAAMPRCLNQAPLGETACDRELGHEGPHANSKTREGWNNHADQKGSSRS
jgi:hypothetical protein